MLSAFTHAVVNLIFCLPCRGGGQVGEALDASPTGVCQAAEEIGRDREEMHPFGCASKHIYNLTKYFVSGNFCVLYSSYLVICSGVFKTIDCALFLQPFKGKCLEH